jgi:Regulator of cell morphogenesis and NO signaling
MLPLETIARRHEALRAALAEIEGALPAVEGEERGRSLGALVRLLGSDLRTHFEKEEVVVFPRAARVEAARAAGRAADPEEVAVLRSAGAAMRREHETAELALTGIRRLAEGLPPAVRVLIERFDAELRDHFAQENDALYP